jgi:fatty acid desaturase
MGNGSLTSDVDHRQLVANLSASERQELLEESDARGLVQLASHFAAIAVCAWLVMAGGVVWWAFMLPLGILLVFLFTALHESVHGTAFRSPWLNTIIAAMSGLIVLVPSRWFTYFHLAHHRHTHDPDHDPELEGGKPETLAAYLIYLTGWKVWKGNIQTLFTNTLGRAEYPYVPERQRQIVIIEARISLAVYVGLFALSIYLGSLSLLWVWVIPLLLGQPFLRGYLLAEHTRCPHVANMLENTRTTFTWPLVRWLAWNMPYHAEHHAYPNVPFWKLPRFHEIAREHLKVTERGYARFNQKLAKSLKD